MNNESISYKLEVFEGPLDLLLKLISRNKLNIYDIPIALIFDQYMEYIEEMKSLDMEIAGEFITMAAELMLIKSRMLLPKQKDSEEEDPRKSLVQALIDYQRAKEASYYLGERYGIYSGRMIKEQDEIGIDKSFVADQDSAYLIEAFERILNRQTLLKNSKTDIPQKNLNEILTKSYIPVHVKLFSIRNYLRENGKSSFATIISLCESRSELIASFLAVLQMIKTQRINIVSWDEDGIPVFELNDSEDGEEIYEDFTESEVSR